MQLLLIKLNAIHTDPEFALLGKKQSEDRFSPGDWSKVRSLSKGRRVLLLLPNSEVVLTQITVPSKNKKQLHQAVPYALEDNLAEDIEDLHFAIHQEAGSPESLVAVINKKRLDLFVDLLRKKGLTPHFILPQVLAQPRPNKGWSILQQMGKPATVRLSNFFGFSCDKNLLNIFITEQLETHTPPESVVSNLDASELPEALQTLNIKQIDTNVVNYQSIETALPLNLLTGFISHKRESAINWKAWRTPLVLASLIGAAWLGMLGWQNAQLKQQQQQLESNISDIYLKTFPGSRKLDVGVIPGEMNNKLKKLQQNTGKAVDSPLPLISDISPLIKKYKDMTLKEVRYQEEELVLVMQSPNLSRIEAFKKEAAKTSKLTVSIKSSTTTADKVEATLLISPLTGVKL